MKSFFRHIALIPLLVVIFSSFTLGQSNTDIETNFVEVSKQTLVNVEGDQIVLSDLSKDTFILFLLPKPASKSEGKEMMQDVRFWMSQLDSKHIYSLLIVEPLKTSFPFYNVQKGKLKDEPYPVVIDKRGGLLRKLGVKNNRLTLLVANKDMQVIEFSTAANRSKTTEFLNKLISETNK